MAINIVRGPRNAQHAEHGKIGARVGRVGIEKRAVPIKQDCTREKTLAVHKGRIVTEKNSLVLAIAERENIVALNREIVEAGGVSSPTRRVRNLRANDMR